MKSKSKGIVLAVLAALAYSLSIPFGKLLLNELPSTFLSGLLYVGAGMGMSLVYLIRMAFPKRKRYQSLGKGDGLYVFLMVALDIAAPSLLMYGLSLSSSSNTSLLNNFEIVATSLFALVLFKEKIGVKTWIGIILIFLSSFFLSLDFSAGFSFELGSVFVLLASLCWGLENNCTRRISEKDPYQIVIVKGFGSGAGALVLAYFFGGYASDIGSITLALLLGFLSYGLSVFFYVEAQHELGAAKTSCYYAFNPFLGGILSLIILKESLSCRFALCFLLMAGGIALVGLDRFEEGKTKQT